MSVIEMIALVAAVSEFVKIKLLSKLEIKGTFAVILTAVVILGVVGFDYLKQGKAFNVLEFLTMVVQVFVGSNVGYQLLKVPSKLREA